LVTALEWGKELGFQLPDEMIIYAMEVDNVINFGEKSATAVSAAIPGSVTAISNELNYVGCVANNRSDF